MQKLNAPFMFKRQNSPSPGIAQFVKLLFACLFIALFSVSVARAAADFLDPAVAFKFSATEQPGEVDVHYKIADGYYMYRERFSFAVRNGTSTIGLPQLPAGHVKFKLDAKPQLSPQAAQPAGHHVRRYASAFVSYATKDRGEVLRRVQMLRALGLEVNNHMSSLDADDVARIRRSLEKEKQSVAQPQQTQRLATTGACDAVICLGAVIRGDTPHFEYVAGECAAGIMRVTLDTGVPIVFGVLTVDDLDQALARCGGATHDGVGANKGEESAATAVEMVSLLRLISQKDQ